MDSRIGRILKRLAPEIPWSHLVLWVQESYAFHVHSHEIQQWMPKAQNKIQAIYVPHQSGMFKSYFFPAVFSCFCNLLPSVNSQLPVSRTKNVRGTKNVSETKTKAWCFICLATGCQVLVLDGFEPLIFALGLGAAALGENQPLY